MSYRFRFSFVDPAARDDPPVEHHFRFLFLDEDAARAWGERDGQEDLSGDFTAEIEEEFGLHDVGFNPQKEITGFSSDEVARERWDELMGRWRDYYIAQGLRCGPVEPMTEDPWL